MRFFTFIFSIFFLLHVEAKAQAFITTLENWQATNPIEKTYLQLDRDIYFSGQIVWFKAYFMSGFLPSSNNSTLFVELLNNQSTVVVKKVLPVFGALSYGQIELPDSLPTASYQLRAYTPLALNFDKSYLYSRRIMVFGKNKIKTDTKKISLTTVQFFPEGGNLVQGINNNIAFKATDGNGMPVAVSGNIINQENKTVVGFSTQHDGMGVFTLSPKAGDSYRAILSDSSQTIPLPQTTAMGVGIQINNNNNSGKAFTIEYQGNDFIPAYMVGQMQHTTVFKQALKPNDKKQISGNIETVHLPSGVLQITLFNNKGMPLAERLSFVNNKEYILPARFTIDTLNTNARKKNHYTISFKDSVTGNFSLSVTDAAYEDATWRSQNIISSFLLSSDIPGYVHNPAYYFNKNNGDVATNIDLVMLTNGWRRFNWTNVISNTLPAPTHKDPGFISLSGKVNIEGTNRSFADRDLLVWVATDSGRSMQMVKTDAEGRFKMDSMIFFNKARILFSDVMGNKSKFITVKLNTDSLYASYSLPALHIPNTALPWLNNSIATKMNTAYNDYTQGEGVMLDSVVVLGTQTRLQRLEEKYMSSLFAGGINAKTYDLTRTFISQLNIFDYLVGRIPSLMINGNGMMADYRLYYRQAGERIPMTLYLDEVRTDADMIASIPASQIALIKVFPTFVGAPGGGAGGVLAVYTKRGDDANDNMPSATDIVDYEGYSIMKEFYTPDYSNIAENKYNDLRLTLDWKPEIFISGKDADIPIIFYNNDRTKKFKITAEGITSDGRLLMMEHYIQTGN